MEITIDQLKAISNKKEDLLNKFLPYLNEVFKNYEINSALRINHFLSQCLHESNVFSALKENLNYSAEGLLKTFKKYFKDIIEAKKYERNPEKIANHVYCNRMGNGDEKSGDGFKYIGRGILQTTGKNNYQKLKDEFKIDFIKNPELLENPEWAVKSAALYWKLNNLNILADKDDLNGITLKINGGTNGLKERGELLKKCKEVIK